MNDSTTSHPRDVDVVVVGGGLAGLTAAAIVAREDRKVVLVEGAAKPGGRAATQVINGASFNLGGHALYCQGAARRTLSELGVSFVGHFPSPGRSLLLARDGNFRLPTGLGLLLTSRLLSPGEKVRLARLFTALPKMNTAGLESVPLSSWIHKTAGRGNLALMLGALFRVATYVADHDKLSAAVGLDQLKSALVDNVWYIDQGWQSLVDGACQQIVGHGGIVRAGSAARSLSFGSYVSVGLDDGETISAPAVILAVDPKTVCQLCALDEGSPLARFRRDRLVVRAACLDVALDRLPRPEQRFALGLEQPTYFSVHSAAASLAPPGVAVIHTMKYLSSGSATGPEVEAELETVLDRVQPGWQAHLVARRFLPSMVASEAIPLASDGGLAGRPHVTLAERPGVYLAGDWVGGEGLLADAAVASARQAAEGALAQLCVRSSIPGGRGAHVRS